MKRPWNSSTPSGDNYRGEIAADYLAERVGTPAWVGEDAAVAAFLPSEGKVLDVPFGTGRFVPLYQDRGLSISGIDISPDMLAIARQQLGPVYDELDVRLGDATALPWPVATFDAVVCIRFLGAIIPSRLVAPCLSEMRRVTKVGGVGIMRLNNRPEGAPPARAPSPEEPIKARLSLSDLDALLAGCGWQMVDSIIVRETPGAQKRVWLLRAG